MSEAAGGAGGADGAGRGRGRGRGGRGRGRGGRGRGGNSDNNDAGTKPASKDNKGGVTSSGGGGGGGEGNKNRRRIGTNNNNNNKTKGQPPQHNQLKPAEPKISVEEKKRIEEERKHAAAAEAERKRLEQEQKAAEAALEARRKEKEELETKVREARDYLKGVIEATTSRKQSRATLQAEELIKLRKSFEATKKTLKSDLKKCTAFVKKIKSGGAWSMKPADITRELSTLNLSRYVEEVVAALLEAKLKLPDMPVILALCTDMHVRYPEFLSNLLPALWSVIHGKSTEEAAKFRRIYVRLVTEFLLNGIVAEPKQLVKLVTETTGGKDGSYAVTDANIVVAFAKTASFEIFGIMPQSIRTYSALIRQEAERQEKHALEKSEACLDTEGEGNEGTNETEVEVVISKMLAEDGMSLVEQLEQLLEERAVSSELSQTLVGHCKGAHRTLANSLVATHGRLQKLEKRCEQDRLLSGSLTEAREKGLSDARKLLDSLKKSVEALSDVLDQPMPQLEEEESEEAEGGGVGVELWTKGDEDGAADYGPFDDEETRAFYSDIPDLLTTIPPALLGMTPEDIEKRKAENLTKFGTGFEPLIEGDNEAAEVEVEASSEAQLEAAEQEAALGSSKEDGAEAEGTSNYCVPTTVLRLFMRLMCY
jgi:regulator of nonsense transcripts 2